MMKNQSWGMISVLNALYSTCFATIVIDGVAVAARSSANNIVSVLSILNVASNLSISFFFREILSDYIA